MPKNAYRRSSFKKKSGYGKKKYTTTFRKRYGRTTKPVGATWKANVKYGSAKYSRSYPTVKRSTLAKAVKRKNLGVSKYQILEPLNWYSVALTNYNQGGYNVAYLTGKPVDLHGARLRYSNHYSTQNTAIHSLQIMGQDAHLEVACGPNALLNHTNETNSPIDAFVDVYICVARKDISSSDYGVDTLINLKTLYEVSYTDGTEDTVITDMSDPHFTPFMNTAWCRAWKVIRKESFRLDSAHPNHTVYHKQSTCKRFDDMEYGGGKYLAIAGLTTCAVVHWRGQVGLNNGGNAGGADVGNPVYVKPPQLGAIRKACVNYVVEETQTNESYYIDTLADPVGTDKVYVFDRANEYDEPL